MYGVIDGTSLFFLFNRYTRNIIPNRIIISFFTFTLYYDSSEFLFGEDDTL